MVSRCNDHLAEAGPDTLRQRAAVVLERDGVLLFVKTYGSCAGIPWKFFWINEALSEHLGGAARERSWDMVKIINDGSTHLGL